MTEGTLILKGERKEEREDKNKNFHRVERHHNQRVDLLAHLHGADLRRDRRA